MKRVVRERPRGVEEFWVSGLGSFFRGELTADAGPPSRKQFAVSLRGRFRFHRISRHGEVALRPPRVPHIGTISLARGEYLFHPH